MIIPVTLFYVTVVTIGDGKMFELINPQLCCIEETSSYCTAGISCGCPCMLATRGRFNCVLDYFEDQAPKEVWYSEIDTVSSVPAEPFDWVKAVARPPRCIASHGDKYYIELCPEEKEVIIEVLHNKWIEHLRYHTEDSWVHAEMVVYDGDPPESWPVVLIPICSVDSNGLERIYTAAKCFTPAVDQGETVFAKKGVLEFLQAHHIENLVGAIDNWNFQLDEQEGLPLASLAFKAHQPIGKAFTTFVTRYGGSIKMREKGGWCFFDSE